MRFIEVVRKTVEQHPDRLAVVDSSNQLTYSELWNEAKLASGKLSRSKPGYVMLKAPRCCQLVVDLLSVWLSGHAPLMLDPATPAGRVEELRQKVKPLDSEDPADSSNVEYLVTTSGSAGLPKVVKIGTGSLFHVVKNQVDIFKLNSDSSVAWLLSPGFDASLSDLGTALSSGATLVCQTRNLPETLDGVTHIDIPPSLLQVLSPTDFPPSVQTLVIGGEASRPETLRHWARHFRAVAVYGPSETTICSSTAVVDQDWDAPYLGQPLPGVSYRIDKGELLIGGPTVGLGYLDPPDPDPFFRKDGLRWYRTGDLVGPSHPKFGHLFRGRKDRQIQLRGRRFEPEELERRGERMLNTQFSCEIWRGQIVLCWRTLGEPEVEKKTLREALTQQLSPGWLPHHYLPLDSLPQNMARKVDRPALISLFDRELAEQLTSLERLGCELHIDRPITEPVTRPHQTASRGKRLLVTGLTGRLGQALHPYLEEERYELWSLQRTGGGRQSLGGDLTKPNLGLDSSHWDFLQDGVDAVLYLAGKVDLSLPLATLKAVNCEPLQSLLRLKKPLHYASTLAVPLCTTAHGRVFGGYAQSKAAAEQTLRNHPGLILRYGQLFGKARTDELLTIALGGLLDLGCCPVHPDPRLCFDWTPLDWAAQHTVQLLQTAEHGTYPIRRGLHYHLNDLARLLGSMHHIESVSPREFFDRPPTTNRAALAQLALWKCGPQRPPNPAFDLFLLGNSRELLATSQPGPDELLEAYLAEPQ